MTPEQRAADAVKACICADEDCLVGRIALAIRAAENETLERAMDDLRWCAGDAEDANQRDAAQAFRYAVQRLRSLKHPEGER